MKSFALKSRIKMGNRSSLSESESDYSSEHLEESTFEDSIKTPEPSELSVDFEAVYDEDIHCIHRRLGKLSSYYKRVWSDKELAFLAEDFPIKDYKDKTMRLIAELESASSELREAVRQNPKALKGQHINGAWRWPRLLGCTYEEARTQILKDVPEMHVNKLCNPHRVTSSFCPNVVTLIVNEHDIVTWDVEEG